MPGACRGLCPDRSRSLMVPRRARPCVRHQPGCPHRRSTLRDSFEGDRIAAVQHVPGTPARRSVLGSQAWRLDVPRPPPWTRSCAFAHQASQRPVLWLDRAHSRSSAATFTGDLPGTSRCSSPCLPTLEHTSCSSTVNPARLGRSQPMTPAHAVWGRPTAAALRPCWTPAAFLGARRTIPPPLRSAVRARRPVRARSRVATAATGPRAASRVHAWRTVPGRHRVGRRGLVGESSANTPRALDATLGDLMTRPACPNGARQLVALMAIARRHPTSNRSVPRTAGPAQGLGLRGSAWWVSALDEDPRTAAPQGSIRARNLSRARSVSEFQTMARPEGFEPPTY